MHGQRGTVGFFPETLVDHGSSSSNAAIEQQVCWNNIQNPIERRLPDCLLSTNDMNIGHENSIAREEHELIRWSFGEPNSSGTQCEVIHNERKMNHGWPSSMSAPASSGPRLEERQYEQKAVVGQSSNSSTVPQDINLNASLIDNDYDSCQVIEQSNLYKPSGPENERMLTIVGPEAFLHSSGSCGYAVGDNDSRPGCSYEGSKRKAIEGNAGKSSSSGSSHKFHRAENSVRRGVPSSCSVGSSVNISAPSEQVQPGQGLDVRGSASESIHEPIVLPPAEGAQRNFRWRLNPSRMHQPIIPPMFSTVDAARQSFVSSYRQSRCIPTDPSLDIRSAAVADNASAQNPSFVNRVPNLLQNMQSFRLNVGSSSRVDSSSSSILSGDRDDVPREGHQSRSMARNLLDHHMFVRAPELRAMARNPTNRGLGTGNTSVSGNVASTYRGGSSSGTNASSAPTWVAHPNSSSQYPRRWSELVRRSSMSSSVGAEPGGNVNHSLLASGLPTSPQEMLLSSGVANQGHHRQYPRPMSWLERHDVGLAGIPHSLRTLAAASEGRSRRIASEFVMGQLRHVLDLMRRGEHLRLEDVMILDQSVFFGVADIHDPHRDMRLDVDNMSYEELLALEERIGNVSTGLSEETILNHLKQLKYSSTSGGQLGAEPCCICQEEYNDGENFATLKCGHNFHADCIKQWLMQKNLCPICKTTGLTK